MVAHFRPPAGELNRGDVAGAIASYFGVAAGAPGIDDLLKDVFPEISNAAARDPASWKSIFPGVMAKFETKAKELGLGVSPLQRDMDILRHANVGDANFAAAANRLETMLGAGGLRMAALSAGASAEGLRGERGRSSTDFSFAFHGGPYSASNLSSEMRSHVDYARGIDAAHVAGVGNYLHGLGINAPQFTPYFVGSSDTVRSAIQQHVRNGAKLTDEHIANSKDVNAIIGAIKAGKIKRENAPPSVQQIMKDMESKGIDPATADPKVLDQYFKDNPKALDAVKKEVQTDKAAASGLSDQNIIDALDTHASKKTASETQKQNAQESAKPSGQQGEKPAAAQTKPAAPTVSAKL